MHRLKRGDTLIEVLISVALFSVAAIAAVGIMNHGLNNTQSSLEITMARTEIDAQAEALRFIHDSYSATKGTSDELTGENPYQKIWHSILMDANDPSETTNFNEDITKCTDVYEEKDGNKSQLRRQNAFIINSRRLGDPDDPADPGNGAYIKYNKKFQVAEVNPRLIYTKEDESLYASSYSETSVLYAEGIWIVAVRDRVIDTYGMIEEERKKAITEGTEYLDFYIHTCWDTPGSRTATNLSSVIRLHNPDAVIIPDKQPEEPEKHDYKITYYANTKNTSYDEQYGRIHNEIIEESEEPSHDFVLPTGNGIPYREENDDYTYTFLGWGMDDGLTNGLMLTYDEKGYYKRAGNMTRTISATAERPEIKLYAVWQPNEKPKPPKYCLYFIENAGGDDVTGMPNPNPICSESNEFTIPNDIPTRIGQTVKVKTEDTGLRKIYGFMGWDDDITGNEYYPTGDKENRILISDTDQCTVNGVEKQKAVCLYARWTAASADWKIKLDWGAEPQDLDLLLYIVYGSESTSRKVINYSGKVFNPLDNSNAASDARLAFLEMDSSSHNAKSPKCISPPNVKANSGNCPEFISIFTRLFESTIFSKKYEDSKPFPDLYVSVYSQKKNEEEFYFKKGTTVTVTHTYFVDNKMQQDQYSFEIGTNISKDSCWNVFGIEKKGSIEEAKIINMYSSVNSANKCAANAVGAWEKQYGKRN